MHSHIIWFCILKGVNFQRNLKNHENRKKQSGKTKEFYKNPNKYKPYVLEKNKQSYLWGKRKIKFKQLTSMQF